jgi:hypothetical protein
MIPFAFMVLGKVLGWILHLIQDILKWMLSVQKRTPETTTTPTTLTRIGAFVAIYLLTMFITIFGMVFMGVNPTLVLSVVAAPYWILMILVAWKLSKALVERK